MNQTTGVCQNVSAVCVLSRGSVVIRTGGWKRERRQRRGREGAEKGQRRGSEERAEKGQRRVLFRLWSLDAQSRNRLFSAPSLRKQQSSRTLTDIH